MTKTKTTDDLLLPSEPDSEVVGKKKISWLEREFALNKGIWIDKDGNKTALAEMSSDHIKNVLSQHWQQEKAKALRQNREADYMGYHSIPRRPHYRYPDEVRAEWLEQTFVELAITELEKRGIDYDR